MKVALSSYKNTEGMDVGLVQEENARLRQDIVNISGEFNSLQQAADSIRSEFFKREDVISSDLLYTSVISDSQRYVLNPCVMRIIGFIYFQHTAEPFLCGILL